MALLPSLQMNISLGDITLSTSSQTVGLLTDLFIRVVIVTFIPNGATLQIALPSSVFYTSDSIACQI